MDSGIIIKHMEWNEIENSIHEGKWMPVNAYYLVLRSVDYIEQDELIIRKEAKQWHETLPIWDTLCPYISLYVHVFVFLYTCMCSSLPIYSSMCSYSSMCMCLYSSMLVFLLCLYSSFAHVFLYVYVYYYIIAFVMHAMPIIPWQMGNGQILHTNFCIRSSAIWWYKNYSKVSQQNACSGDNLFMPPSAQSGWAAIFLLQQWTHAGL